MRLVMKFGGSSISKPDSSSKKYGGSELSTEERINNVVNIIKNYNQKNELVVVVSAMSNVTNMLVDMAKKTAENVASEEDIKNFVGEIREGHRTITNNVVAEDELDVALIEIERLCKEMEKILIGILYVGDLTPKVEDYVVSFGERLSATIISGALKKGNIESKWLTGFEAGIITTSEFGKAKPRWDLVNKKVPKALGPSLEKGCVSIVTGFIAGDARGYITTLGRGGSDYTAAILGSALNADEIWIWTDVDGIMTTDPKIVSKARVLSEISYSEAIELAFFGAKVLHPKTLEPAMEKGVHVRVKNSFKPERPGTLIVKEGEKYDQVVKAISVMEDVSLVNISGTGMIGIPGIAARVFGALGKANVNILMISQASSEVNISVMIGKDDSDAAVEAIEEEFEGTRLVRSLNIEKEVAIIAVIGAGMRGTKGVAGRIFTSVAEADANILMIAQGSSEVNVSFVVSSRDAKDAALALHGEFELEKVR